MSDTAAVLAFDLGAGSGRALIGELRENGTGGRRLEVTEIHRFPNQAVTTGSHLHWDFLRLLHEVKTGIRKACQAGYEPGTLGIDTWGVDFGLLDRNGELLGNPYHYRDPQTDGLVEEVGNLVGEEELYAHSGVQFMPFNTIYQLYAMRKAASPKLDAADTLLLTPDLLAYYLTGRKVCEFTMATTTGLYDPLEQSWNRALMDRLGIPSGMFLEPVKPGEHIGPLTEEVREELGVQQVTVVAVGSHDTESAIAAVPAVSGEPFAYLVCGTWSLLGTELAQPNVTPEARALDFSNEGGVGNTYQLLKNIMGLWILQECKRQWEELGESAEYPQLIAEADSAAPFRSLIRPDDSRFYAPADMLAELNAYIRETGQPELETRGQIVRCILESLAFRYREALEQTEQLTGRRFGGLHMVGGGIQNELLCRFTAGALGRPVWAGPVEASSIGNMLVQLMAGGHCASLREARQLVADSFVIRTYELEETESWERAYESYSRL
ncbi:rhamnulokinase [Paenibacillus tarimensis]|uniref:rhamnulokinase n=1 Tax=Paenibacillus tarimensis TaxID=416012 RepID=UPI001F3B6869|nr:rhamnulokinase family protein [Paenibacillus tarimensis]MCF2943095.1 rhamnulokinase [Paenibacillus tarimensis]